MLLHSLRELHDVLITLPRAAVRRLNCDYPGRPPRTVPGHL